MDIYKKINVNKEMFILKEEGGKVNDGAKCKHYF